MAQLSGILFHMNPGDPDSLFVSIDFDINKPIFCKWVATAMRKVYSTTFLLSTGSTPGIPRQTGQVWVLGDAPKVVEQLQKIFVFVFSCA
jgi:hypothetical protein